MLRDAYRLTLQALHTVPPLPPIVQDPDSLRRQERLRALNVAAECREFDKRRDGMIHAMDGGLWLHRHVWMGEPLVHLVSTDRARLVRYGDALGLAEKRLQYKPLKDPRTEQRREAWHWDLGGPVYPPPDARLRAVSHQTAGERETGGMVHPMSGPVFP